MVGGETLSITLTTGILLVTFHRINNQRISIYIIYIFIERDRDIYT